nr:MAG TPA: hypothetical protein [Caudoviricetes sp.]
MHWLSTSKSVSMKVMTWRMRSPKRRRLSQSWCLQEL